MRRSARRLPFNLGLKWEDGYGRCARACGFFLGGTTDLGLAQRRREKSSLQSARTSFRVFYNEGHPERRQQSMTNYTALQQVAHLTDAIVAVVKKVSPRPTTVHLPGRHRYKLLHKGVEVLGPIRRSMTDITRLNYIAKHFQTSRKGTIAHLHHATF